MKKLVSNPIEVKNIPIIVQILKFDLKIKMSIETEAKSPTYPNGAT